MEIIFYDMIGVSRNDEGSMARKGPTGEPADGWNDPPRSDDRAGMPPPVGEDELKKAVPSPKDRRPK